MKYLRLVLHNYEQNFSTNYIIISLYHLELQKDSKSFTELLNHLDSVFFLIILILNNVAQTEDIFQKLTEIIKTCLTNEAWSMFLEFGWLIFIILKKRW